MNFDGSVVCCACWDSRNCIAMRAQGSKRWGSRSLLHGRLTFYFRERFSSPQEQGILRMLLRTWYTLLQATRESAPGLARDTREGEVLPPILQACLRPAAGGPKSFLWNGICRTLGRSSGRGVTKCNVLGTPRWSFMRPGAAKSRYFRAAYGLSITERLVNRDGATFAYLDRALSLLKSVQL
jgi:hypothetical protein